MAQAQYRQDLVAAIANAVVDRLRADLMRGLQRLAYWVMVLGAVASLWLLLRG